MSRAVPVSTAHEWVKDADVEEVLARRREWEALCCYIEDLESLLAETSTSGMCAYIDHRIEVSKAMHSDLTSQLDELYEKFARMERDLLRLTNVLETPKQCLPSKLTEFERMESTIMREQLTRIDRILSTA